MIQGDWRFVNQSELYNVKTDRLQKNDIAAQHPQIVSQMKAELKKFIQKNAQNREEPVRFVLGDPQHKTIELTTQDLWEKSAFSQGHVQKCKKAKAHGRYSLKTKWTTKSPYLDSRCIQNFLSIKNSRKNQRILNPSNLTYHKWENL